MGRTGGSPWIDALNQLEREPDAAIPCPVCAAPPLRVIDVELAERADEPGVVPWSRYLVCDACGARVVASGKRPSRPPS